MITETLSKITNFKDYKHLSHQYAFPLSLHIVAFTIPFPILVNNLSIIILGLLWLLTIEKDWSRFKNIYLLLSSFLPFYLWYTVGISYSHNTNNAFNLVLERSATFLIFPIILFSSKLDSLSIKNIFYSFTAGFILILCISIGEILLKIYYNSEPLSLLITQYTRWNFTENSSLSYHTPYMGMHAIFCYAIILVCLNANKLSKLLLKTMILILLCLGVYIFGSKLPFILFFLVSLFYLSYLLLFNHLSFAAINICVSLLLLLFISIIYTNRDNLISTFRYNTETDNLYWGSLPNRFIKFLEVGDEDRLDNWGAAICAYLKHPVLGSGTGDGLESIQSCRSTSSWNYLNKVNAHNQYLDIAVRSGIIGLILFLTGIICCFRLSLFYRNRLYILFLISFSIGLIFEDFLDRQKGVVFFMFINTLFLSYHNFHGRAIKEKSKI